MKKSIQLFALFVLSVCLSCGSKTRDEASTDSVSVVNVTEVSPEAKKAEERAAKRAKIEKAKIEKEAQRKAANEETSKASPSYKDASGKIVYYKVESEPSYPGGNDAMIKYLNDNLVYPKAALENQTEGTVFVDFVVSHNGKVREVNASDVAGDDDQSLKEEAGRIVAAMPAWVPGRLHGKAVDTKFSIPITFEIN